MEMRGRYVVINLHIPRLTADFYTSPHQGAFYWCATYSSKLIDIDIQRYSLEGVSTPNPSSWVKTPATFLCFDRW